MSKIIFSKGKPNKNLIYAISLLMFIVAGHNSVYSQTFVIEPQTGQIMSFGNIIVSGSIGSGSVILSPSSTRTFSSGVIAADNLNVSAIGFRIRATSFPNWGSINVALIMPSSVILYGPGGTHKYFTDKVIIYAYSVIFAIFIAFELCAYDLFYKQKKHSLKFK